MARFFNILLQGFDWEGLDNRTLDPPITPKVLIRENDKKKLMYLQVQGPSDTSNFDKYPRDEIVPGDEISGWDKEFWAFFKNVTKLLVRSKSVGTFFVRTSAFKYLDSGDISWQPIVIQGCISRTAGRLLCKKPHLCSRTLLCIWKGAQDIFLYYAFDVQYVQKRKIGSWTKNTKSQSFEKWKKCVDNHRPLWFFVIFVDIL